MTKASDPKLDFESAVYQALRQAPGAGPSSTLDERVLAHARAAGRAPGRSPRRLHAIAAGILVLLGGGFALKVWQSVGQPGDVADITTSASAPLAGEAQPQRNLETASADTAEAARPAAVAPSSVPAAPAIPPALSQVATAPPLRQEAPTTTDSADVMAPAAPMMAPAPQDSGLVMGESRAAAGAAQSAVTAEMANAATPMADASAPELAASPASPQAERNQPATPSFASQAPELETARAAEAVAKLATTAGPPGTAAEGIASPDWESEWARIRLIRQVQGEPAARAAILKLRETHAELQLPDDLKDLDRP